MRSKRIHYAWIALIGSMIVAFSSIGLAANAFAAYQPYLISRNGFTNAQSSFILTVRSLFTFLGMFLTGSFYKKISYRRGMAAACLIIAMGFFLFGIAKSYVFYLFSAAVLGLGYGLGSMIPAAIVIGRWFYKKRTLALSICNAVTGVAMFGIPNLITSSIETYGLKTTFWLEAGAIVLLAVLSFLLIRNAPEEIGMKPYGEEERENAAVKRKNRGVMDKKNWMIMAPVMFLTGIVSTTAFVHITVHAVSCGFSTQMAASGLIVLGICLSVGKILYGILAEKTSAYTANWVCGGCLIAGSVCATLFSSRYPGLFFAGLAIYGLGLSLPAVGCSNWASDLSDEGDYAKNVRRFNTLNGAGNLLFSVVPGVLADCFSGSYVPAYILFTVFSVIVLIGVQTVYRRWMRENGKSDFRALHDTDERGYNQENIAGGTEN